VGSSAQRDSDLWYDELSGSAANQRCGNLVLTQTVTRSSPSGSDDPTIYSYSVVGTKNVLTITPTDATHVGTWVFTFKYCLPHPYSTVCDQESTKVTIALNCAISGNSPPSSDVIVFAAAASYSAFTAFTASVGCGTITYSATATPATGV